MSLSQPPSKPPRKSTASWGQSQLPRPLTALLLMGQVLLRLLQGRFHRRNLMEHLAMVGPGSLKAVLLVSLFSGMIFTVQTARELTRYGALEALGGAFALAFCRELAPVLTAGVVAGQVGSAFAAELGTMRVTEQIDALQMMRTDPVDYLVTPRVVATVLMLPILTVFAIVIGIGGGAAIALHFYEQPPDIFLNSVRNFLTLQDLAAVLIKAMLFALIIASLGCSWGLTTTGGAKGVGQSATAAVVTIWIGIFMADFLMSLLLFGTVAV